MKKLFLSFLCLTGLTCCNGQNKTLNEKEFQLIKEISLDQEIAEKIKSISNGNFIVSTGFEDREMLYEGIPKLKLYSQNLPKAIKINATTEAATEIVREYRAELKIKDLIIYKSEENYGQKDDFITILKSKNKYEPLYFEGTNAVNYDMNTPELVEKLKLWDELYGIEFNGVGFDFISGNFNTLPKDLTKFSKEMYEFCPDIVDQGVGDVEKLEEILQETKAFFLWWD